MEATDILSWDDLLGLIPGMSKLGLPGMIAMTVLTLLIGFWIWRSNANKRNKEAKEQEEDAVKRAQKKVNEDGSQASDDSDEANKWLDN